jgi:hypothetical protein
VSDDVMMTTKSNLCKIKNKKNATRMQKKTTKKQAWIIREISDETGNNLLIIVLKYYKNV